MADHKRGRGVPDGDEMHPRGDEEDDSECKSAQAIRLLREVTTLLSETTDQPSKHVATGQVAASASKHFTQLLHNICSYCQLGLSLSSSVPTKKNPVKPKFFQPKETWMHDFCLASKEQVRAPSRAEKFDLQQAGLGRKKICFNSKAKFPELRKKLEEEYPKLSQGGGFELMRTGHQGSKHHPYYHNTPSKWILCTLSERQLWAGTGFGLYSTPATGLGQKSSSQGNFLSPDCCFVPFSLGLFVYNKL